MKDLQGIKGKYYIAGLIEEGEHEQQDFKFAISDARKIARTVSAFANRDGGRLLVGVKDNGMIAGVRNEEDIYIIEQAASMYCSPPQKIQVAAFKTDGDKLVLRIEIGQADRRPVVVLEADGSRRAYYRVKDENIVAPSLMVRAWIACSKETGTLLPLFDRERKLLSMIEKAAVRIDDFMLAASVSKVSAEETIIRLYSMRLIDFEYNGREFLIVGKDVN